MKGINISAAMVIMAALGCIPYSLFAQQDSLKDKETQEVQIVQKRNTLSTDTRSATMMMNMGKGELLKAACCNLSESFETNPSVDVNYADAVTGTKQIQMLGLTGNYISLQTENIPDVRGLNSGLGLSFIPGTWVKSIQITKGPGSVVNGFESMAGAMNIEQQKPEGDERFLLNGYLNQMGRSEANLNWRQYVGREIYTGTMLHVDTWQKQFDRNGDGFMDAAMNKTASLNHRWRYRTQSFIFQGGVRGVRDERWGGQMNFQPENAGNNALWGSRLNFSQGMAWAKVGYMFPDEPYRSIGLLGNLNVQESKNWFGLRQYNGTQRSAYFNGIYQSIWGSTLHSYKTGFSFQSDFIREQVFQQDTLRKARIEQVAGLYYEHTWTPSTQWTIVGGIRADHNNLYGNFITPRIHAKWDVGKLSTIRFLVGRGQKTANVFAENMGYMASGRKFEVLSASAVAYGLRPEVSWTYGLGYNQDFTLWDQNGSFNLDAYRTDFQNQVVLDLENPQYVRFYNLNQASRSVAVQADVNYHLHRRWEMRLAYRVNDVRTQYAETGWQRRPYVARDRFLFNTAYTSRGNWKWDLTLNIVGEKRLPNSNDAMRTTSPAYPLVYAQVTKVFSSRWEVYAGVENLTDFRQKDVIVAPQQPFSSSFDASYVWGPIVGRMVYFGFRYQLVNKLV